MIFSFAIVTYLFKGVDMKKTLLVSVLIFIWLISPFIFARENDSIKITREKWGEMVGFEPNLNLAGYEPGLTIDSANADKFKSAPVKPFREFTSAGIVEAVRHQSQNVYPVI